MTREQDAPQSLPHAEQGTRSAEGQVTLDASPERVWHALTDARELERWFPLDARVEPGRGGRIWMSWRNEFVGDMKILEWDPPHHLRTTWSFHDEGESAAQVTDYIIAAAAGGRTILRVVTSGFPDDASWDGWVEGTRRGWAFELRSLKHYLERHAGETRNVAYVRRRVPLSAEQTWERLERSGFGGSLIATTSSALELGQYTGILTEPSDALLRLSVEPGGPGVTQHEIVVFASAWGDQAGDVAKLQGDWSAFLERTFPEGAAP